MATTNDLRCLPIFTLVFHSPDDLENVTMRLWKSIAHELVSIISEDGFSMLFVRSIYKTRRSFPWLAIDPEKNVQLDSASSLSALSTSDKHFALLKVNLREQSMADADAASKLLLSNFTHILVELIGEVLTTRILRTAWGDHASDTSARKFDNE